MLIRRIKLLLGFALCSTFLLVFLVWSLEEEKELQRLDNLKFFDNPFRLKQLEFTHVQSSELLVKSKLEEDDIPFSCTTYRLNRGNQKSNEPVGAGIILTDSDEINEADNMILHYSYNTVASDKLSLDRPVPDTRPTSCKYLSYDQNLPPVSIVIVFHNEYLSVLLRTIHSILNRTPTSLLREILLVDDGSDDQLLDFSLKEKICNMNPVKLIRLPNRHGLIQARATGIQTAVSDFIVIMDAHVEVNWNWLPPLLSPVVADTTVITEPVFDRIDWNTFEYNRARHHGQLSSITWSLSYYQKFRKITDDELITNNFENPILLGAVMAFYKLRFINIGGFDPDLQIWGGEQIELSLKTWMCGGRVLTVPCSHVGHNFKDSGHHPYLNYSQTYIAHNLNRIAEVWMDDYKQFYYFYSPERRNISYGDVNQQVKLRQSLQCKSFAWFLRNHVPDLYHAAEFELHQ